MKLTTPNLWLPSVCSILIQKGLRLWIAFSYVIDHWSIKWSLKNFHILCVVRLNTIGYIWNSLIFPSQLSGVKKWVRMIPLPIMHLILTRNLDLEWQRYELYCYKNLYKILLGAISLGLFKERKCLSNVLWVLWRLMYRKLKMIHVW